MSLTIIDYHILSGFLNIYPYFGLLNLVILNGDLGSFGEKVLDESDGGGFTSIASVGLESEAQDGDALHTSQS